MKKTILYSLPLITFIVSGCAAARVIPYDAERVDQEIYGNRGIVTGSASHLPIPERKKTRRMYDMEIELLSPEELGKSKEGKIDAEKSKTPIVEKKDKAVKKQKGSVRLKTPGASVSPQVVYQKPAGTQKKYEKEKGVITLIKEEKEPKIYVVEKGDTLQKISDKMYGTTKKWKKIYEANRDALESPDMIKLGQRLVIPME